MTAYARGMKGFTGCGSGLKEFIGLASGMKGFTGCGTRMKVSIAVQVARMVLTPQYHDYLEYHEDFDGRAQWHEGC